MLRTYALILLATVFVSCTTSNSKPASSSPSPPASQLAGSEPPAAKSVVNFDAKCGVTEPSPIETVAPEDRKRVIPPRADPRHPLSYPDYPASSRRSGHEGSPQVRALVTETGAIDQVKLAVTSGYVELDNAALESLRNWQLMPARIDDHPVCMWATFRINFKLPTNSGS